MSSILVTGVAGFIGLHIAKKLLDRGEQVIGIDNLSSYYDVDLKKNRLSEIEKHSNFKFQKVDLSDRISIQKLFEENHFDCVINLAAQAGVRFSLEKPYEYIDSNLVGFHNILEGCRQSSVPHLIFASSSSVYGANSKIPFSTSDHISRPMSLYAATKASNELMAYSYSHLYGISMTGLRFFTVYGPWGRPDMAPCLFAEAILKGHPINIFNNGLMSRDFTYIDDVVKCTIAILNSHLSSNTNSKNEKAIPNINPSYKIYNIGSSSPIQLMDFIEQLEVSLGQTAKKIFLPMQPGDVSATYADTKDLEQDFGFYPSTSICEGIEKFSEWYKSYYYIPV